MFEHYVYQEGGTKCMTLNRRRILGFIKMEQFMKRCLAKLEGKIYCVNFTTFVHNIWQIYTEAACGSS